MSQNKTAVPTVIQVSIMGEAAVGGTLTGSYLYQNADENPEGLSTYRWYNAGAGNSVIATTIDLTLLPEHEGVTLKFSIVPVAASGETGVETFSDTKIVVDDRYQNISDEESENSFLKQRGQFAFHANSPKDRIFTSTSGAFALKNRLTQNVSVIGAQNFGGVVPAELAVYLKNNPAITLFTTINSFGALVPVGDHNQLLVWGPGIPAALPDLQNIRSVYSNNSSLAFIYENPEPGSNTIGAVGTAATGGVVPVEVQNKLMFDAPLAIYATIDAFAVRTNKGKVYTWGSPTNGGAIPADVQTQLNSMHVQRIVASQTAFCALTENGDLIAWGVNGPIPATTLEKIYDDGGAQTVIANGGAFCAITLGRRKAATWGLAAYGGTMSESAASLAARGNIALCAAAPWAMCFINESGQAAAWGYAGYGGGDIPASGMTDGTSEQAVSAQQMFEQGDTKIQIENLFKGVKVSAASLSRVSSKAKTAAGEDIEILRNDASFVLLAKHPDGRTKSIITWGLAATGGTMPNDTKQVLLASRIRKIYCSNGAYAALVDQGQVEGAVVTWGRASNDGGSIPANLQTALSDGVVEIYTIQAMPAPSTAYVPAAFAARKSNNNYVTWGAYVKQEEFTPEST